MSALLIQMEEISTPVLTTMIPESPPILIANPRLQGSVLGEGFYEVADLES